MNRHDKKIYGSVVNIVRKIEHERIIDEKELSSICSKYKLKVNNPSVMLAQIAKNTRYLDPLENCSYIRTSKK